jgi:hypothetical protein
MIARERTPRVLTAVAPRAAQRMSRILAGWEVSHAASLAQFAHELRCSNFDLMIVGCHFDGSRALEAVKTARAQAPEVPLVCVLAAPFSTPLGEATVTAFHTAAEELGVDCFVDVLQFADEEAGNARIRGMLERLVFVT